MKAIATVLTCLVFIAGCASTNTETPVSSVEKVPAAPSETREPSAAKTPATSDQTADVSGRWTLAVDTDLGAGSATFFFQQSGEVLTGEYTGVFGVQRVTGTVHGNEVAFSFVTEATGVNETIAYTGTVAQNSMTGAIKLGEQGSGTFNGKKEN